jgi:aldehyde dehydrogenase
VLVGRERECHLLDELLGRVAAGSSATLLMVGEAGIGKTCLIDYALGRAEGFEILEAAGIESEQDLPASYVDIGLQEGAQCLIGGQRTDLDGDLAGGYYFEPTVLKGDNSMRVFQEEIFGPVLAVTTFTDEADAIRIANDTLYGLGAGVWTRDGNRAYRMGRAIQAGRVWTNCYHLYPAGAAFGGYKMSGVGRENHAMMLEHYSQTKNLLVSYSTKALGLF